MYYYEGWDGAYNALLDSTKNEYGTHAKGVYPLSNIDEAQVK